MTDIPGVHDYKFVFKPKILKHPRFAPRHWSNVIKLCPIRYYRDRNIKSARFPAYEFPHFTTDYYYLASVFVKTKIKKIDHPDQKVICFQLFYRDNRKSTRLNSNHIT